MKIKLVVYRLFLNGKLVGIITETDLLYNYIELTGAHQPGSQIDIRVQDKPGILFEVSKVFHEQMPMC